MAERPRLILFDAMALIYRAHFAYINRPLINSKGMNTSAIQGFLNSLLELINLYTPTHLAVVYDTDKPTFRHDNFAEYKANRAAQPEDISLAMPYIKKILDAMGLCCIGVDGYEADDVIGTLSVVGGQQGFEVYMVTPDKDFAQLVGGTVYQYKPSYMKNPAEVYGEDEIRAKWSIGQPSQVIDILGLMGDSIDNIPGVPGIGEKTAKKLIAEWGSIENILDNLDRITGKIGDTLRNNAEMARMSKALATIDINVPLPVPPEALKIGEYKRDALREIFAELEFRTLTKRILGEEKQAEAKKQATPLSGGGLFDAVATAPEEETKFLRLNDVPHTYALVQGAEAIAALAETLRDVKALTIDTETSGTDPMLALPAGIGIAISPGLAWYIALPPDYAQAAPLLQPLKPLLQNPQLDITGQNIKYDFIILSRLGIRLNGVLTDTMLLHYLLDAERRHSLDIMARQQLGYETIPIEAMIGKGKGQMKMTDLDPSTLVDYACEDVDVTLRLRQNLEPMLDGVNARKLYDDMEGPLIRVLADMEMEGVRIDKAALDAYSIQLGDELRQLEGEIHGLAGGPFNISSPKEMGTLLFDHLKLSSKAKRTSKSKQYATGEDVLSALAPKHPIAAKILEFRQLSKLKSTYVDSLPLLINPMTGRVHTNYNQAVAATGRLSSTDPNLQNIPIRTDKGREIRKAFVPRNDDHILISADYSQIELRLIAAISGEQAMIEAFRSGIDVHTDTASRIYAVALGDVTGEMRRRAKMVNFGIIYGISAHGLGQRLGIPRSEAADIIAEYDRQYPGIKNYLEQMIEFARAHGYVETLLGRRRYLRDIDSRNATQRGFAERNAINAPIQGTAADMIKLAMINIDREMKRRELKSRMILQVHDELVFDAHKSEAEEVMALAKELMATALKVNLPIEVEAGSGPNWLAAH